MPIQVVKKDQAKVLYMRLKNLSGSDINIDGEPLPDGDAIEQGQDNKAGFASKFIKPKHITTTGNVLVNLEHFGNPPQVKQQFIGLLDEYPGAAAAYSLRQLSSSYTGSAIRVRRSSDNTEQDIGFVYNELDTATLESFCSGTDGFVTTWYDQSGNGNDAAQATASAQPKIVSAGSTILENEKPAVSYDSSNDILIISNASSMQIIGDMYWAQVCNGVSGNSKGLFIKRIDDNNREYEFRYSQTIQFTYLDSANRKDFSVTASTAQRLHSINRIANTSIDLTINGSAFTQQSLTGTQATTSSNVGVGGRPELTFYYGAKMQEILLYASDQSSNRTGIETNINSYYSIY